MAKSSNPWVIPDDIFEKTVEPEYVFDVNPLALIICLRNDFDDVTAVESLKSFATDSRRFNDWRHNEVIVKKVIKSLGSSKDLADEIIEYYTLKFATEKLTGYDLSDFRKEVCAIGCKLKLKNYRLMESEVKVLFRLVDFYKEDIIVERLMENYESCKLLSRPPEEVIVKLEHVETVDFVRRRNRKEVNYFRNVEDNSLCCIGTKADNNLLGLLNFFKDKQFIIKGHSNVSRMTSSSNFYIREFYKFDVVKII